MVYFGQVITLADAAQASELYNLLPDLERECMVQIGVAAIDRTFEHRPWYNQYADNISLFQPDDSLKEAVRMINIHQVLAIRRRQVFPIGKGSWELRNGKLVTSSFSKLPPYTTALFTNNSSTSAIAVNETLRCLVNTAASNEDLLAKLKKIDPRMREAEWIPLDSELERHKHFFALARDYSEAAIIELVASVLLRGVGKVTGRPILKKFYKDDLDKVTSAVTEVIRKRVTKK